MPNKPTISEEEFTAWRDDPVTAWVFRGIQRTAALQREAFSADAWATGKADQQTLTELRTRADAYLALIATDYRAWLIANEETQ